MAKAGLNAAGYSVGCFPEPRWETSRLRHGGERHTYDVRLAQAPAEGEQLASTDSGAAAPKATEGKLGIAVEVPSADFLREARLTDDQRGVLVSDVEEGGPAWAKLYPPDRGGPDLVIAVNDARVRTTEEFQHALAGAHRGDVVQLRVFNVPAAVTRIVRIRVRG